MDWLTVHIWFFPTSFVWGSCFSWTSPRRASPLLAPLLILLAPLLILTLIPRHTHIDPVLNLISMLAPSLAHLKSHSCLAYTRPLLCYCAPVVFCVHLSSPMWLCGTWPESPSPEMSFVFCVHLSSEGVCSLAFCIHLSSPMWLCGGWPQSPLPELAGKSLI